MKKLIFMIIAIVATSFIACEGPDDFEGIEVYKSLKSSQNDTITQPDKGYPGRNDNLPPS